MRAMTLLEQGQAEITQIAEPEPAPGDLLLKVEMVGLCGTDLNSFRGRNAMLTYPRVLGHEIAATVLEGNGQITRAAASRFRLTPAAVCARHAAGDARMPAATTRHWGYSVMVPLQSA